MVSARRMRGSASLSRLVACSNRGVVGAEEFFIQFQGTAGKFFGLNKADTIFQEEAQFVHEPSGGFGNIEGSCMVYDRGDVGFEVGPEWPTADVVGRWIGGEVIVDQIKGQIGPGFTKVMGDGKTYGVLDEAVDEEGIF